MSHRYAIANGFPPAARPHKRKGATARRLRQERALVRLEAYLLDIEKLIPGEMTRSYKAREAATLRVKLGKDAS